LTCGSAEATAPKEIGVWPPTMEAIAGPLPFVRGFTNSPWTRTSRAFPKYPSNSVRVKSSIGPSRSISQVSGARAKTILTVKVISDAMLVMRIMAPRALGSAFGQPSVNVPDWFARNLQRKALCPSLSCSETAQVADRRLSIPEWMFDRAACCGMARADSPRVDRFALPCLKSTRSRLLGLRIYRSRIASTVSPARCPQTQSDPPLHPLSSSRGIDPCRRRNGRPGDPGRTARSS
jgi:hypothetical protein